MQFKYRALRWYKTAEFWAKAVATVTALIATLAFLFPWFGGWVNMITAQRFGIEGFAFYEVAPDPDKLATSAKQLGKDGADTPINDRAFALTTYGNFYAPRSATKYFEGISRGDLLQAGSAAYLHEKPTKKSAVIYQLRSGDCVLVLDRNQQEPRQRGYSGGWFHVVTAACGLFR